MAFGTIGLATYRWNNVYKAVFLLLLFPAIYFSMLWWQVYLILYFFEPAEEAVLGANNFLFGYPGAVILMLAFIWLIFAWRHHASLIRGMAYSVSAYADLKEDAARRNLQALIEKLCIQTGLATPELEIMETAARNAFVCSDGADTHCLYVTRGLIESLNEDEIEAVIAHEIAHVLNKDNRLLSFNIAFSGLFPLILDQVQIKRPNESPAAAKYDIQLDEFALASLVFLLFFPLWAAYILTSVVRIFLFINREFDADAKALEITKNPDALMRALKRIHRHARLPFGSYNLKFLCIDNPEGGVFATHPRLHSRLALISALGNCPVPNIENSSAAPLHSRFSANTLLKRKARSKEPDGKKPYNSPWKI